MSNRHAICLCIDGLRASALGSYGNTTYPTTQADILASRSTVVDWLIADSPSLQGFYRSAWCGEHALRHAGYEVSLGDSKSIAHHLKSAAIQQFLFSDEAWLTDQIDERQFVDSIYLENRSSSAASGVEATCLGQFFSAAIEHLQQFRESHVNESSFAWLHSRGMCGPWDAPLAFREQLLDEEDPAAEQFIEPPQGLRGIDDPDQLLSYRTAYAAQMMVLDACLGALVEAVREMFGGDEALLMLFGSRGFPLGEHGSVGVDCNELYTERVHLPLVIWPCANNAPVPRESSFAQPADIGATLLDWFDLEGHGDPRDGRSFSPTAAVPMSDQRKLAVSVGAEDEVMVRTPAWSMIDTPGMATQQVFTKPDDRWESNDVSALCPEVVDQLVGEMSRCRELANANQPLPLAPCNEELISANR